MNTPLSTTKTHPLRLGIIGFGHYAQTSFLPALRLTSSATLHAIASTKTKAAVASVSALDSSDIHNSYQQLVQRNDIDAVYIALPNHLHSQWTVRCLNAGLHVLCEKPIALSLDQEQEIDAASRANSKIVIEAFAYRYHPQHQIVKDLIRSNTIGDITAIKAEYSYFLDDIENIRLKADCAGGALFDVGCYLVDLCRLLFDSNASAIAASSTTYNGVDATTAINLLLNNGISASLVCGCRNQRKNYYEIYGTNGKIRVCEAFHVARNKAPRIEVSLRNKPTTAISALKFNQTLGLIEYFSNAVSGNIPATPGITSNGFTLESIKSLSEKAHPRC